MIRYTLLTLFIAGIIVYSWKDWFRALCLLVLLVAVLERRDMPAVMLGIPGLNPFNIALCGVLVGWAVSRNRQKLKSQASWQFNLMLLLVIAIMVVAFLRLFQNPSILVGPYAPYTPSGLVTEFFLNTFKWMIPGLLMYQGCRSIKDLQWAVLCLLALYLVLAFQTIKVVPPSLLLDGATLSETAVRRLGRDVRYHRVELAGVFAGASWAMLAVTPLFSSQLIRLGLLGASGATVLALALTAGRTGYAAWCVTGILLACFRWRLGLLLGPLAVSLLLALAPGISERMLQGISYDSDGRAMEGNQTDLDTVTAGRSLVWPFVLASIAESPMVGYGREAFIRTGLREEVFRATREYVHHPHNGYFQFALDNGLVGLAVLLTFFGVVLWKSLGLFLRGDPQATAAGGMTFSLVTSLLVAAVGAQTFYPTELSIGTWCAIALLTRVSLQQSDATNALDTANNPEAGQVARSPRRRWAVTRLAPERSVQLDGSGSVKRRALEFESHRTQGLPSAGRSSNLRWKGRRQARANR